MAYNNWHQPNDYGQQHSANNNYNAPGQYGHAPPSHDSAPYHNAPSYPQWGQQSAPQGYTAPSGPYQYAAPPPAPPPQSQQVPSYMNYNPGVYGSLASNTAPSGQHPPALPPRTQHDSRQYHGWSQASGPAPPPPPQPFKPSVTGTVRYKFRPDPQGWQAPPGQAQTPDLPASSGYNSGPWPQYQESPQSSPMQQHATTASNPVSPPYSPDPNRTPTLPQRPVGAPFQGSTGKQHTPGHDQSGAVTQNNANSSSQAAGWFNPSGSIFPQAPAGVVPHAFSNTHRMQSTPPPMPPRPSAPYTAPSGPVSPIEHRDSVNSLYDSPPPRSGSAPRTGRDTSQSSSFRQTLAGDRHTPPPRSGSAPRIGTGQSQDTSFQLSLPGDQPKAASTPAVAAASSPSPFALGASSDWEHLGSDTVEDVDDTALYARKPEQKEQQQQQQTEFTMPELDSTEVRPAEPSLEPNSSAAGSIPAPPPIKIQEAKDEPDVATPKPDQVKMDVPIVRTESPEPMATSEPGDKDRVTVDDSMDTSLDSHLRKLTMEESHFSEVTAKAPSQTATSNVDIAPGLDVWYKTSLLRCIAMLYREAGASAVEEKHKIFLDFITEEAKLRGLEIPSNSSSLHPPAQQWSEVFSPSDVTVPAGQHIALTDGDSTDVTIIAAPTSPEDDTEYSPGGRPIVARPASSGQTMPSRPGASSVEPSNTVSRPDAAKPEQNVVSEEQSNSRPRAASTAKANVPPEQPQQPQPPQPPPLSTKPVYTPFRDRNNSAASLRTPGTMSPGGWQGPQGGSNATAGQAQVAYKPYVPFSAGIQPQNTVVQNATAPSPEKSIIAQPAASVLPRPSSPSTTQQSIATQPPQEPVPYPSPLKPSQHASVHRQSSVPIGPLPIAAPPSTAGPSITVQPPATSGHARQPSVASPAVQQLDSLVFRTDLEAPLNPRLENLKTSLLLYPSDYTFVTTAFDKWKTKAAGNRARAEGEARNRHSTSQQHIDALFNENQIAYHDIALLEDSFKKQEAETRRQENEAEYQSYLSDVFDPLYKRLQEEIGAVTELLMEAQSMVKEDGVAGRALLDLHDSDKVDLAEGVGLVVELHRKLEERHDELAECIIKRDRRRQAIDEAATEGADKLTQMEFRKRLDSIERQAGVSRREDKKARVQPLWQLCRGGAMRGTRENKAFAGEVLRAVEAAGDDLVGADQTLLKVRALRTFEELAARSRALEASFYALDTELNVVEYEAAVAHATLDKAPRAVVAKLTEEKDAEDARLGSEHEDRLRAVQATLQAGQDAVEKVSRGLLGNTERALLAQRELESAKRKSGDFRSALSVLSPA